ncbi:corrinoid protein-associated methyltransferase CpaM [Bradyrhizobium sp. Ai1a-2]|uniref:corrinoid protein-associated methyltransferase CpaM n=1 Tax=Bradyrhizobium sp. Ai1a-2 TaxID=196490 RepID=UPI0003FB610E|nr:corrinoid protein-associated methyltransferase CpaM [Bradyrhizobium sp. Ai1a-2]
MLMYGWMKWVEIAPQRYDWAVTVMTFGRLDHIKERIANEVRAGDHVLDIGCGTGTLAVRCLRKSAYVTGIDSSKYMIEQTQRHASEAGLADRLVVVQDSVTQLRKHFGDGSFDLIVSTMVLGEFPREYLSYVMRDCRALLRPGGRLIIADEVLPDRLLTRIFYAIGLGLLWIPNFLLLRRPLFPIADLPGVIRAGGFQIKSIESWAASSFKMVSAESPILDAATPGMVP